MGDLEQQEQQEQELMEVFWNPIAQPTTPGLRYRILPAFNVSAMVPPINVEGGRLVSLLPPPANSAGFVLFDFLSVLPADGGVGA